ncbi:MAG: hypothetical protein M3Y13_15650 [Armatimonadota bacterium]|nr:hypothetical protein [Armatimonadota bacterium]
MAALPTSATTTQPQRTQESPLSWSVHLLRRQPHRLRHLALALTGVFILSLCLFHSFWLALLPAAALLLSLSEFVFPVRYTLTAQSASAQHGLTSLEIQWKDVRHAYLTDEGVKLSPLRAKNSRFESLRGVYLRFDISNREDVMAAVRRCRQEYEANA